MGNELTAGKKFEGFSSDDSVTPESLVPRLGDYLLDAGVITPEELKRALEYQKFQEVAGKPRMLGQALTDLGFVDREMLDQAIARQLVTLHQALQDSNRQLALRVSQRTNELERRIVEIRTAAEITQMATTISSLDELLNRTVNLIADRFTYNQVTIFLIDSQGQYAVLSEASGSLGKNLKEVGYKLPVGSQSIVGWVAANNQERVSANVVEDLLYLEEEFFPNTKSEATIPLTVFDLQGAPQVLGVLDVQHTELNAFDQNAVATLQTIANHIAATIHNVRLLEDTRRNLNELSSLYQVSHQIAQAEKVTDILNIAANSLKKAPLVSAVLLPERKHMVIFDVQDRDRIEAQDKFGRDTQLHTAPLPEGLGNTDQESHTDWEWPIIPTSDLVNHFITNEYQLVDLENTSTQSNHNTIPQTLLAIPRRYGCQVAAFIPVIADGNLEAIFILGSRSRKFLTDTAIQPYASLSELTSTALEKVYALQTVEKRLSALQTLNTISQAVSIETNLQTLYQSVHNEVNQIMGDVNFLIALYDKDTNTISIPYLSEEHTLKTVEPYPLGEGLTSIIINTRKPLMIVEDTENRTRELGAKILGAPAKSWMGVPLLIGGEAIGAIIVQDLEVESRFDEDDLRLMTTLALQVAAGLRNARLLESTYHRAERDRMLHVISRKIRSSTDMKTILKTTAQELGQYMGARRAYIELGCTNDDKLRTPDEEITSSSSEFPTDTNQSIPPSLQEVDNP
jgi:GAF domain-containing protein